MPVWPNLFIKEPNYFSRQVIGDDNPLVKPIRDEQQYLRLFSDAGDAKVVGEASPNYLENPEAPALIDRTIPGAKVIVSLCDPMHMEAEDRDFLIRDYRDDVAQPRDLG